MKHVSSRSYGVLHDIKNLQISLTLPVSTWGSVFPADGKSVAAERLLPCSAERPAAAQLTQAVSLLTWL